MPRPLRIEYPGAIYHVMARGNHGHGIFRDNPDRQRWLETLGEAEMGETIVCLDSFLVLFIFSPAMWFGVQALPPSTFLRTGGR
jgi:hypothetical protein